jgi:hypothetical protein
MKRTRRAEPLSGIAMTPEDHAALPEWAEPRGLVVIIAPDHESFPELAEIYGRRDREAAFGIDYYDSWELRFMAYRDAETGEAVVDDMRTGQEASRAKTMAAALAALRVPLHQPCVVLPFVPRDARSAVE